MEESDYIKYRGKCKELSEQAIKDDPTLELVRGWYIDPFWGKSPHWWTVRADGSIYDPSKLQFPSKGMGEYVEFDGIVECEECGNELMEKDAYFYGAHAYCDGNCCYKNIFYSNI